MPLAQENFGNQNLCQAKPLASKTLGNQGARRAIESIAKARGWVINWRWVHTGSAWRGPMGK
jgi:hypothetical protein